MIQAWDTCYEPHQTEQYLDRVKLSGVSDSIHVFFHYDRGKLGSPGNNPSIHRSKYLGTRVRWPLILSFHSDLCDPVFILNHSQLFLTDDILRGEFFAHYRGP